MKLPGSEPRVDPARLQAVFHAVADAPAADQGAVMVRECGGDERLEAAVRALLVADRQPELAWDATALEVEARHAARQEPGPHPGDWFGPYRIVRQIATGGMGFVYEALRDDAEFHKRVAIKFVQHGIDGAAGIERFRIERQILAQLEHPSIARLLDGGTTDSGIPYLVMEYVDGSPIDEFATARHLSRIDRLQLFLQVCDAVQYAHRNLVIHRDLKPANILVTADGVSKLLDFGIAKLISSERSNVATIYALTPQYASPEQVLGRGVSTSTDIYSLGVLLFKLLTDRLPYRADETQPADLVRAICEEEPDWEPRGLIHGDLKNVIAQALRKEPERRYLSVEQFAADIRRDMQGLPVAARPDTFRYRARKFLVRRAAAVAAVAAIAAALAAGTVSTIVQARRAERRFQDVRTLAHSVLFEVYDSISALPGSVSARRLVAGRAQQYLDSLSGEVGNDPALTRELAESYLRLGDVLGKPYTPNLGDTVGALESYQKGLALLERESARHPSDLRIQEQLNQAYMNVGLILMRQQKPDESMDASRRAIAVAQALVDREPHNVVYREKLAHAYMRLGQGQDVAASQSGSIAAKHEVLATYRQAIALLIADGEHGERFWQVRLSTLYFYVGYPLRDLGDRTGDITYYRQALESSLKGDAINRRLVAATPGSTDAIRRLADGQWDIGVLRWKCCRDLTGAMRDLQEALAGFQPILDRDPHNLEAKRDVANVHNSRGLVLSQAGQPAEALASTRTALAMYEELGAADPASGENANYIADMRARIVALEQSR